MQDNHIKIQNDNNKKNSTKNLKDYKEITISENYKRQLQGKLQGTQE